MDSPIESYLRDLRRALRGDPFLARRILEEVADHLAEAAAEERRSGMSDSDAEKNAVRRFGPADRFARGFDRYVMPFRFLLIFASIATVGVALWLFSVIALVLPARDPGHIPMWRAVALCYLAYSAMSWGYLVKGPRNAILKWIAPSVSVGAVALGLYGMVSMIVVGSRGGHFEGYILLMGFLLAGHGMTQIIYALLTTRITRRVQAT
jgi:hypothetical protein